MATAALALVLVGGVTAGVRATTGQDANYRTAEATRGSVGQTVETSGTVDATQRDDVATSVSGEVAAVLVDTGAKVQAGDVLVRLQRTDAERSLRKTEAAVTQARLDLQDAVDGQTETVTAATSGDEDASSGTSSASSSAATPLTSSTGMPSVAEPTTAPTEKPGVEPDEQSTSGLSQQPTAAEDGDAATTEPVPEPDLPSLAELSALQTAVTSAQTGASDALVAAASALDAQTAACATAYGRGQEASTQDPAATSQDPAVNDACDASLDTVQTAQQAVSDRQNELDSALDGLATVLVAAVQQTDRASAVLQEWADKQTDSSPAAGTGAEQPADEPPADEPPADEQPEDEQPTQQQASQPQQQNQGGTSSGAQVATPTVSDTPTASEMGSASALSLAAAQAALDSARVERIKARQDFEATRIVAVRSGTVTAVEVAVGDQLSAGDRVAVLVGKKGATVTVELSATGVADIAVDQAAEVTLPGSQKSVEGKVTWVSRVSSSTSTTFPGATTATYAVHVLVPFAELGTTPLPQGARANVSIVVGTSEDAVLIPTSALVAGSQPSVRVVTESGVESRTVEIERSGASRTAIASGLDEGDTVVIADLDAEIDAAGEISTDESGQPGFPGGGGGEFPGGGPGGGGFPAGGGAPR